MSDWLITLTVGSNLDVPLTFLDETNAPVNLTGANIRFIVKYAGGSTEWSTANGKVPLTNAAGGTAALQLTSAEISAYQFEFADYEWEIVWANGNEEPIAAHKIWRK